jgi:hypothetical protein
MMLIPRRMVWAGAVLGLWLFLFHFVPGLTAEYSVLYKAVFVLLSAVASVAAAGAGIAFMWRAYPYAYWVFCKYLFGLEWVTGLSLGSKFCDAYMEDSFLLNSDPVSSNAWLYRQFVNDHERRKGMGQID